MKSTLWICVGLLAAFGQLPAQAGETIVPAPLTFTSGLTRVALIELYTSEGCSSCPPAEKWLGELRTQHDLWKRFVPVAFHVNYWDKLGWRDVLSNQEFTQRQYAYADAWHAPNVYTPCFVRDGAEWRPGGIDLADRDDSAAAGQLTLTWRGSGVCRVAFAPAASTAKLGSQLDLSIALLGSGIVSKVRAGENSGRELHHEFVALRLATVPLTRAAGGSFSGELTLKFDAPAKFPTVSRHAVAAWVTRRGELAPIQATGGWLD